VGNLLLQQECCDAVPSLPLEILVAQTQGQIGYMIESTLDNELMRLRLDRRQYFVTLLSYVVVDEKDPLREPSKPIGRFLPRKWRQDFLPTVPTENATAEWWHLQAGDHRGETRNQQADRIGLHGDLLRCGGIPVMREERSFAGIDA